MTEVFSGATMSGPAADWMDAAHSTGVSKEKFTEILCCIPL